MSIDLLLSLAGLGERFRAEAEDRAKDRLERSGVCLCQACQAGRRAELAERERLEQLKKDATREEGFKRG